MVRKTSNTEIQSVKPARVSRLALAFVRRAAARGLSPAQALSVYRNAMGRIEARV